MRNRKDEQETEEKNQELDARGIGSLTVEIAQ